jgi:DNA-directed RNA polymerase subunit RPC12/RpoP
MLPVLLVLSKIKDFIFRYIQSLRWDTPTEYHQHLDTHDDKPLFTCPNCLAQFRDETWSLESKTYSIACPHCLTQHQAFVYWHKHFDTSLFDTHTWWIVGLGDHPNILSQIP